MDQTIRYSEHLAIFVAIIVGVLIMHLAWRGWRDRLRGAKFVVERGALGTTLTTRAGRFTFARAPGELRIAAQGGRYVLPYADILALKLEHDVDSASWQELLFENFGVFDLFARYRDRVHTYTISIHTPRGEVPLYGVSQYQVRDLWDFVTPIMHAILRLAGLYTEGASHLAERGRRLEALFRDEGLEVRIVRG